MVSQTPLETHWNNLMKIYHYLGYTVLVGTCLKYLVFSNERVVAAAGWSSALWKLAARDDAIGWSIQQRNKYLHRVANNTRFLIFPWVKIRNFASYILSQTKRVIELVDYQQKRIFVAYKSHRKKKMAKLIKIAQ